MNVEASHHSPSVTVSIFDALADILTSTPKPRISTTTEVTTNTLNTDVTQVLNGVSNIVNVNSSVGIPSPETFVSSGASSSITVPVQNTQTTPIVNNMSAGGNVTPSLNTEVVTPVNTPTTPLPTPFTPVSARRPFAFKVLYLDTERPNDQLSTAPDTSNQPTTDNPATVYNTVSDLLLSNNNLVSPELTSMLSNNIKSIIQNMDEDSRSRVSGNMAKLLKSLVPRALDELATGLENADFTPNTTPYSLEAIEDTANIDFNAFTNNSLQNVLSDVNVNSIINNTGPNVAVTNQVQVVNNVDITPGVTQNATTEASTQTTSANSLPVAQGTEKRFSFEPSTSTASSVESLTSSVLSTVDMNNVNNETTDRSSTNNRILPFLTNFRFNDFTASDDENNSEATKAIPLTLTSLAPVKQNVVPDIQDSTQISPLQLWLLTKKAKVLEMIEDLLRQHNSEIATAPTLIDIISPSSENIQLSRRLTDIMNNMTFTTDSSTTPRINAATSPMTTSSPLPLSTTTRTSQTDLTTSIISNEISTLASLVSSTLRNTQATTSEVPTVISSRLGSETKPSDDVNGIGSTTLSSLDNGNGSPTSDTTTEQSQTTGISTTTAETVQTTTQANTETTTDAANTETTTLPSLDTTTQVIETESTTQSNTESTTVSTGSSGITTPLAVPDFVTPAPIPKKDYVIFGILPNNTVVRKDPNDDILESLTEASPYIVYGLLPNNTVIRKFPNGTRVPRIMQKIDILPISPWSLRNPYSPIHNIPAIVRPRSNPIRVSTNTVTAIDITNNGTENRLTTDTVNNLQSTVLTLSCLALKLWA